MDSFGPPLHLPFWNGNADDAFSGRRFQAGISGAGRRREVGGLLREDDGRVVFRHGSGQAVGRGGRLFAAEPA